MQVTLARGGSDLVLDVEPGTSILRVLQDAGIAVHAACGGNGTCGKCLVPVRSSEGLSYRLACQTPVEEGMTILAGDGDALATTSIAETGLAAPYAPDAGGEDGFGLAFDIGTTTVVCHLHRLSDGARLATASAPNPQSAFGADVISRISASMEGRLEPMREAVASCMADLERRVFAAAGLDPETPARIVVAGNTVMQHIACGLAPDAIGTAPFTPQTLFGDERELPGLGARAFLMPCIAGYVGGDITAGIVATALQGRARPTLLIDVGTNGEMVLGCADRMVACATATGPAFEGANISCGMPALPGAIARVRDAGGGLELETVGGLDPVGICGTGLIEALAVLLDLGVIDETGLILDRDEVDGWAAALVGESDEGNIVHLDRAAGIRLTQRDVRNLQLAKAAVHAGILTLLDAWGIGPDEVDELLVAGGFGSSIDVAAAARIGLFPRELAGRARAVGNAAGEGAAAVLVSQEARGALDQIVSACGYLELSANPEFNGHYVECMGFE